MGRSKTENGERAAGLVNSELFGAVNREALRRLQDSAQSVVLEKGQTLFLQGDVADAIYIVEEGSIEVSILGETGKKLTLNVMRSNDVFGEIAALDGGVRTASAAAASHSKLRKISRQAIFNVMRDHPDLAMEIIRLLCGRIRWISQQVEDLAMVNTEKRLARKLIVLSKKFARADGMLQMSQSELADFLGVTRESVNKILQHWISDEIVTLGRSAVKIRNHQRLSRIANEEG